ncbi:hypothetical protein F9U38_12050 [Pectobacterium versatile]|uniref:hypothetical protein n=1 Tax=Pectobacterium versatile TaxID=2488639 RepID=UPI001B3A1CB1|nr:hypothetical protein [Pectobacterium versatile]MBQ4781240.1 hypothetical protein [Pectobacterium versatile]MBQ4785797.1 hypothetical protein [Pectobacterium versatile]
MGFNGRISGFFRDGDNNTEFCTDWKFLTADEKTNILEFIKEISTKEYINGKNKESWVDDNHHDIQGAEGYKEENYWHYHCGPKWFQTKLKSITKCMHFNPDGLSSYECIHYYPSSETKNEIIIVGYSRNHIPFLLPSDPDNAFFK